MGLYDTIVCHCLLPGTPPIFVKSGHEFQTKSLESMMDLYQITSDGLFVKADSIVDYHGDIYFYTTNLRASDGKGNFYTSDGSDYEWVCYRARISYGRVDSIIEVERERDPAKPMGEFKLYDVEKEESTD